MLGDGKLLRARQDVVRLDVGHLAGVEQPGQLAVPRGPLGDDLSGVLVADGASRRAGRDLERSLRARIPLVDDLQPELAGDYEAGPATDMSTWSPGLTLKERWRGPGTISQNA